MKRLAPLLVAVACATPGTLSRMETAPEPEPEPDLVDVAVPRELRGLWVATVANLDFPSKAGLSVEAQQAELDVLVERAAALGLNALVFQVRPEADALYDSPLEPWSRYLTGTQGQHPGFDPLAYLVDVAHQRGLEVHAWFNPYRAASSAAAPRADSHVSRWAQEHTRRWGNLLWLDPGAPEVQQHALAVVSDVLTRYDIDGVHLDDYFYPYPEGGRAFPDEASYQRYRSTGGELERDAWRRHNVDTLVEGLARTVHAQRPHVRFGISPFGIYRPGYPEGIRGMDQVTALHADPMLWYERGWVDYLAPQLYWPTTKQAQRYDRLVDWWNHLAAPDRPMLVGLDCTKVGKDAAWTLDELRTQVTLARQADRTSGHIWFRARPVLDNQAGLADLLSELYQGPAVPPPIGRLAAIPTAAPAVARSQRGVEITHAEPERLRTFVLYRADGASWQVDRLLPPGTRALDLEPGTWALSAVARSGVESRGLRVELPEDDGVGFVE